MNISPPLILFPLSSTAFGIRDPKTLIAIRDLITISNRNSTVKPVSTAVDRTNRYIDVSYFVKTICDIDTSRHPLANPANAVG